MSPKYLFLFHMKSYFCKMQFLSIFFLAGFINKIGCCGECFRKPSYISQWFSMEAQNSQNSEITVRHGLNELPSLVDVQVKPEDGFNDGFIFPGIGSAQRDDDLNTPYGGIVYMYNENTTVLMAPNKNDDFGSGSIIYTGNVWRGSNKMNIKKAKVRIRIWNRCDIPSPDYVSQWLDLHTHNASGSYLEILHGLTSVPEYVHARVRLPDGRVTDGIGSSMLPSKLNSSMYWGGVLYGFDKTYVRIWIPGTQYGRIFSATDGWGRSNPVWHNGLIQVRVWKYLKARRFTQRLIKVNDQTPNEDLEAPLPHQQNITDDLFLLTVMPNEGSNNGYQFIGSGGVQNTDSRGTLGGFVYSYSESSARLYHPPFPLVQGGSGVAGYLLYINGYWGNGINQQMTNKVTVVLHQWTTFTQCPVVTTEPNTDIITVTQSPVGTTSSSHQHGDVMTVTTTKPSPETQTSVFATTRELNPTETETSEPKQATWAQYSVNKITNKTWSITHQMSTAKTSKTVRLTEITTFSTSPMKTSQGLSPLAAGIIGTSVCLIALAGLTTFLVFLKRKLKRKSRVAEETTESRDCDEQQQEVSKQEDHCKDSETEQIVNNSSNNRQELCNTETDCITENKTK